MRDSPKNELMFQKALGTDGGRKRDEYRQSETIRIVIVSDVDPHVFGDEIMEETKWRGERHDEERLRRGGVVSDVPRASVVENRTSRMQS